MRYFEKVAGINEMAQSAATWVGMHRTGAAAGMGAVAGAGVGALAGGKGKRFKGALVGAGVGAGAGAGAFKVRNALFLNPGNLDGAVNSLKSDATQFGAKTKETLSGLWDKLKSKMPGKNEPPAVQTF